MVPTVRTVRNSQKNLLSGADSRPSKIFTIEAFGARMIGSLSISILHLSLLLEATGKSTMVSFWSSSALTARLEQLKHAESKLLQLARRYAASSGGVYDIRAFDTMIPRSCIPSLKPSTKEGDELVIHAVQVQTKTDQASDGHGETSDFPLVALHGYYNGAAYYYRNLLGLASYFQNVYSLDCLGWGLSSRPKYSNLKRGNSVESAEEWFVESLEGWREANKIERMVLLGHSFGGYMSVAYAERYPHRVERLLLLSPVGVPDENDPSFQERKQRFTSTFRSRMFVGTFQQLFDWTTVGGFLRTFVSEDRAYNMAGNYVQRRLTSIEERDEQEAITDYLYNNAMAQGSGEYTVHAILTNNILARRPLQDRIPKLQVKNVR